MANPTRGEVDYVFDGKHYTFKFGNAGKRATEDMLDMESSDIMRKLDAPGDRIKTALFFGATRKHHLRDFPNLGMVDRFMDDITDAKDDCETPEEAQEIEVELLSSLYAAYLREDKSKFQEMLRAMFRGEILDPEQLQDDEEGKAQEQETKGKEKKEQAATK